MNALELRKLSFKELNEKLVKGEIPNGSIMGAGKNFGCGSSREHAPWALYDFGIRLIIGESFAEIFAGNCTALGVPAVIASPEDIAAIQQKVETDPTLPLTMDLEGIRLNRKIPFEL